MKSLPIFIVHIILSAKTKINSKNKKLRNNRTTWESLDEELSRLG